MAQFDANALMQQWYQDETTTIKPRLSKAATTLHKILVGPLDDTDETPTNADTDISSRLPRIALSNSGGGWRAMSSVVGILDALSTPLPANAVASHEEGVKPLDAFTHAFGLSGGSWGLYLALAGGQRNVFHSSWPTSDAEVSSVEVPHPWLFGQDHRYDPETDLYKGLSRMLNVDHVSRADYLLAGPLEDKKLDDSDVKANGELDITFVFVMVNPMLGPTLVDRWANFIANDLLSYANGGKPLKPAVKQEETPAVEDKGLLATTEQDFLDSHPDLKAALERAHERHEFAEELFDDIKSTLKDLIHHRERFDSSRDAKYDDPNLTEPSHNINLSSLRPLVETGDFPFVVLSAIANSPNPTGSDFTEAEHEITDSHEENERAEAEELRRAKRTRTYDWVEFSPFFARRPATGVYTTDVDRMVASFTGGDSVSEASKLTPLHLHHFMGICSSAFACDIKSVIPEGLLNLIRATGAIHFSQDPLVGSGVSDVYIPRPQNPSPLPPDPASSTLVQWTPGSSTDASYLPYPVVPTPPEYPAMPPSDQQEVASKIDNNGEGLMRFGRLRDAGVDFNVPIPPLLPESGQREFDIIIMNDSGAGVDRANELQLAVDEGYLELQDTDHHDPDVAENNIKTSIKPPGSEPFNKGERMRIYRGKNGFPSIIYFLGLTKRGTSQTIYTQAMIDNDIADVRASALQLLVPALLQEMHRFMTVKH